LTFCVSHALLVFMKSEINDAFPPIQSAIDVLEIDIIERFQLIGAVEDARELAEQFRVVERMRKALQLIQRDYLRVWTVVHGKNESEDDAYREKGLRVIRTEVTQGMINQSIMSLTKGVQKGMLKLNEEMVVTLPDPEKTTFTTQVTEPGNKLKDRKHVRIFYEENKVTSGDVAVFRESESGRWLVSLERRPNFDDIEDALDLDELE